MRSTGPSGELEALKSRVAKLEGQAGRPSGGEGRDHPVIQQLPAGQPQNELTDLRRRIEILERQGPAGRPRPVEGSPSPTVRPKSSPEMIEAQKKRFLDTNQPVRSRLAAMNVLRMQGAHKSDDIVDSALTMLGTTPETNLRASIIRNLQGAENPRVIPILIQALKGDPAEEIREESAKTLGDYVAQPEVKAALEQASTGDASERVKNRAKAALAPK
jgi:hypothetical protein